MHRAPWSSRRLAAPVSILLCVACGDDGASGTASATDEGGTLGESGGSSGSDTVTSNGTVDGSGSTGTSASEGSSGAATEGSGTGVDSSEGEGGSSGSSSGGTGSDSGGSESGSESTGGVCPQGEGVCLGNEHNTCDGMGGYENPTPCGANVCVADLGCVECIPGSQECDVDNAMVCDDLGQWQFGEFCDGLQGVDCDANLGECIGACSAAQLGLSYIGCEYYPTVTQQHDSYNNAPTQQFAVAVANTSGQVATVTITQGAANVSQTMVAANDVGVIVLPWVNGLTKGEGPSVLVADGAYRLRSDQPVTVYQYNPLNATTTNDASLLLPVNAWGTAYVVASWPYWSAYPGFYAVVAAQDGTVVDIAPSATGGLVQAGGGVAANGDGQVMLDEGDVLEVMTSAGGDLTGTMITANEKIQVIGGHSCTNVPSNITACDHLEESLFPIDTLAKEYIVVPPVQVPNDNLAKAQIVRVIATEADTMLTFDPDQGVANLLNNVGDFVETPMTTDAFSIVADKKVLVTQYMVGQSAGYGTSDPAMVQTVPSEQFRSDYLFHAATTWTANYVDIVAETGTAVSVDGVAVAAWAAIGITGFSVAHVALSNAGNGNHTVSADQGVGISVYGLQNFGSYWYPGGLDLSIIPQ